jgi:hypothetical protein
MPRDYLSHAMMFRCAAGVGSAVLVFGTGLLLAACGSSNTLTGNPGSGGAGGNGVAGTPNVAGAA